MPQFAVKCVFFDCAANNLPPFTNAKIMTKQKCYKKFKKNKSVGQIRDTRRFQLLPQSKEILESSFLFCTNLNLYIKIIYFEKDGIKRVSSFM